MADMKTLTLGGKTFNIMDEEARAKAIPTVQVGGDTLTWDGNTEGKKVITIADTATLYKVSDATPSADYFANGVTVVTKDGETLTFEEPIMAEEGSILAGLDFLFIVVLNEDDGYEPGVYFNALISSLAIPGFSFAETKIDPAYLYQPDWNQTNETAADFIKNKPFGGAEVVMVSERVVSDMEEIETNGQPDVGGSVTVICNGNAYECLGQDMGGMIMVGNLGMFDMGEDTGEPFLIGWTSPTLAQIFLQDGESATISVTGKTVKTLPLKYIRVKHDLYVGADENDIVRIYKNTDRTEVISSSELMAMINSGIVYFYSVSGYNYLIVNYRVVVGGAICVEILDKNEIYECYTAEYVPETT